MRSKKPILGGLCSELQRAPASAQQKFRFQCTAPASVGILVIILILCLRNSLNIGNNMTLVTSFLFTNFLLTLRMHHYACSSLCRSFLFKCNAVHSLCRSFLLKCNAVQSLCRSFLLKYIDLFVNNVLFCEVVFIFMLLSHFFCVGSHGMR